MARGFEHFVCMAEKYVVRSGHRPLLTDNPVELRLHRLIPLMDPLFTKDLSVLQEFLRFCHGYLAQHDGDIEFCLLVILGALRDFL